MITNMAQQLDSERIDSYSTSITTSNYDENALLLSGVGIVPQEQLLVKDLLLATTVPYLNDTTITNTNKINDVLEPSILLETAPTTSIAASTTVESNPTISSPGLRKIGKYYYYYFNFKINISVFVFILLKY